MGVDQLHVVDKDLTLSSLHVVDSRRSKRARRVSGQVCIPGLAEYEAHPTTACRESDEQAVSERGRNASNGAEREA
jgi:hypothetical protein